MNGRTSRIVTGIISVFIALFLAWRIGLWLEPEPQPGGPAPAVPSPSPANPPFATGTIRKDLNFEVRNVVFGKMGKTVEGTGIIRFDSEPSDLKAAAVAMVRKVKEKAPAAEVIRLLLKPAVECPVCTMADVKWEKGKVTLRYGVPTLEQMEEANALIGKKKGNGEIIDRPRLYRPDRETFAAGLAVTMAIEEIRRRNPNLDDERVLEEAAAATGLNYVVARRHRDFMAAYYTGDRFGEETFTLSLP